MPRDVSPVLNRPEANRPAIHSAYRPINDFSSIDLLGEASDLIEALRSKKPTLLSRYEDLYSKAFSQLKEDPVLNRVDEMKQDMIRAQENRLGIDVAHRRKGAHSAHGKKTEELAANVTGSSLALPGILA